MSDLPPEILATAFEKGVLSWGVRFLPPVCLVCKGWNNVVQNTPHLWGIIWVTKSSKPDRLMDQIHKAKDALLTVYISPRASESVSMTFVLANLVRWCGRWAKATVPVEVFIQCRWTAMFNALEELQLLTYGFPNEQFFTPSENDVLPPGNPALRVLSMAGWYQDATWTKHLLSPSLEDFCLVPGYANQIPVSKMLNQLARIPNARTIEFHQVHYHPHTADLNSAAVHLEKLISFNLSLVNYPSLLLSNIACPSLRKLTLGPGMYTYYTPADRDQSLTTLAPFLSQWSQPGFVPTFLHTLVLCQCMQPSDIPYLLRFLAQLPNLVVLILNDGAIDDSPEQITDEDNVFKALSSPEGARNGIGGWLCPSLVTFRFENVNFDFQDLLAIARVRGCRSSNGDGLGAPKTLRKVSGLLCSHSTREEALELGTLLEEASCGCWGCALDMATSKWSERLGSHPLV